VRRKYWWRFGEVAPALYEAIAPLNRCLITSGISKHRVFALVHTEQVFSHNTYVFPLPAYSSFCAMQSRIHVCWSALLSSGLEDRGGYRPSDCFDTFPFAEADPRTVIDSLEAIGDKLYETRAAFMVDTDQGLTKTYNALKDPDNDDPRILELRRLHEEMDRAVLDAYGWDDIPVPPTALVPVEEGPTPTAPPSKSSKTRSSTASTSSTPSATKKKSASASTPRRPARRRASAPRRRARSRSPRRPPTPSKRSCSSAARCSVRRRRSRR